MGIISINGQQVYVIDSKPVAAAKASNGVGYAQLVSQQRWKLYEQAENDVLRQMEFEKMGYQAQLDAYAKQKEQLTKALARAQEVKNKIASGDASYADLMSLAKADAAAESRAAATTRTTEATKPYFSRSGKLKGETTSTYRTTTSRGKVELPSERLARLGGSTGIKSPKELEAEAAVLLERDKKDSYDAWTAAFNNRTDKSLTEDQWKLTEEGAPFEAEAQRLTRLTPAQYAQEIKNSEDENDAKKQSEDYIASLESQLGSLGFPAPSFDTNVGARTREAYAGMAGMGGLGLAPRKSKISPVYDESRAREAMARQAAGFEDAIGATAFANETDLKNNILKRRSDEAKKKIEDFEALGGLESDDPEAYGKLKQQRDNPALTTEEQANIARTARQAAEQSFRATALETGPGERTLGSFMDRAPAETGGRPDDDPRKEPKKERGPRKDIDLSFLAGLGALGRARSSDVYFGSGEGGEAGLSGIAPEGALTVEGRQFEQGGAPDSASMIPDLQANLGFGATTTPESVSEFRKFLEPDAAPDSGTVMQRLGALSGRQPGDSAPSPVQVAGEAGISGPARISPAVDPEELWFKYAPINFEGDTGEQVQLTDEQKRQISDKFEKDRLTKSLRTKKQIEAWYKNEVDMLPKEPSAGKAKKKTRLESYSANLMKVMQEGQKLADQPTKLQRLAKLDLPEKERSKVVPEHILLVDKLYNVNSVKGDAFQTTFAEIERVYKNDEKKKKAAQEYLAAKEILTA